MTAVNYKVSGDVAILEIDNPPVNALSFAVREGLMSGFERAAADPDIVAAVMCGAKGTFPAGADINEIASGLALKSPTLLDLQGRMEAMRKPLVAALQGNALGGGFELALTCHWRVASPLARVGLPEVKLGLIPGAGGTQRFTRLAGPEAALGAITTGEQIPAERAHAQGLVDAVAQDPIAAAVELGRRAAREGLPLPLASETAEHIRDVSGTLFSSRPGRSSIASRRPVRGRGPRRSASSATASSNAATARNAARSPISSSPSARRAASPGSAPTSSRSPSRAPR